MRGADSKAQPRGNCALRMRSLNAQIAAGVGSLYRTRISLRGREVSASCGTKCKGGKQSNSE